MPPAPAIALGAPNVLLFASSRLKSLPPASPLTRARAWPTAASLLLDRPLDGGVAMHAKRRPTTRASANRPPPVAVLNQLLAALPPEDYQRIAPSLETIPLVLKEVLQKPGEPIRH